MFFVIVSLFASESNLSIKTFLVLPNFFCSPFNLLTFLRRRMFADFLNPSISLTFNVQLNTSSSVFIRKVLEKIISLSRARAVTSLVGKMKVCQSVIYMIAYSKLMDNGFFGNKIFFRKTIDFHEIFWKYFFFRKLCFKFGLLKKFHKFAYFSRYMP